jgi:CrcB protein
MMSPAVQRLCNDWAFPIGTFSVNMLGCFVIGFLGQLSESRGLFQSDARLFLFVGVLGGFTTFSSFGFETFQLMRDGEFLYAGMNAVLQVVLGLLLVWLGWVLGRLV